MKRFITLAVLALMGLSVGSPAAHADDFRCVGVVGPITVDNVVVPRGAECMLDGTRVLGNVKTKRGGNLFMFGAAVHGNVQGKTGSTAGAVRSRIDGDYQCDGCVSQDLALSSLGGNFQVTGADDHAFIVGSSVAGDVEIVDSGSVEGFLAVEESIFGENVKFEKNAGEMLIHENEIGGELQIFENNLVPRFQIGQFTENQVGGNMQIFKNQGPSEVSGNIVGENLQCKENVPPPIGGGNVAEQKEDQCAAL
jgi:hypothetical protein